MTRSRNKGAVQMRKLILTTLLLAVALVCFAQETDIQSNKAYMSQVKKVVDGDTLILINNEQVRLIGIDCPENEYSPAEAFYLNEGKKWERDPKSFEQAKEATEFVKKLVEGREVRLEFDVERRDKSGRLLAYVYFPVKGTNWLQINEEGVLIKHIDFPLPVAESFFDKNMKGILSVNLNAYIIQEGYANLKIISPNAKYADLFKKLYQEARDNKKGLWKE